MAPVMSSRSSLTAFLCLLACLVTMPLLVSAHETRPAYLEIIEKDEGRYEFTFRQPQIQGRYLGLGVVSSCEIEGEETQIIKTAALETRWVATCSQDILRSGIRVAGLERTLIDTLVHIARSDGDEVNHVLTPDNPVLEASGGGIDFLPAYFVLGVEHLVFGIDHVAFLLILMYLLRDVRKLIIAITSFTVAHSITLGIAAFDLVFVPQQPVEAIIALSILVVAWELTQREQRSLLNDYLWSITFVFGLLHGLGFAGAMSEIGLPENSALTALLLFNIGIEAGQLIIIALVLTLTWLWRRAGMNDRAVLGPVAYFAPVYVIGGLAAYWFMDRTGGILFG